MIFPDAWLKSVPRKSGEESLPRQKEPTVEGKAKANALKAT